MAEGVVYRAEREFSAVDVRNRQGKWDSGDSGGVHFKTVAEQ